MNKMLLLLLWCCWVAGAGCSSVRTSQDYRPNTNFSDLETYRFRAKEASRSTEDSQTDPLVDERIRKAIVQDLDAKGYRQRNGSPPDFFIDYNYTVRQVLESDDVGTGFGIGTWGGGTFGGVGIGTGTNLYTREQGVLTIDFVNPQDGKVLWRGKGTLPVAEHWDPETKTEKVNELVTKVLAQFPPSP